jgi:hypothetical protein
MAKDHGPSAKNDKQYEGLRKRGMSKQRAASIANSPSTSSKGGKRAAKAAAAASRRSARQDARAAASRDRSLRHRKSERIGRITSRIPSWVFWDARTFPGEEIEVFATERVG